MSRCRVRFFGGVLGAFLCASLGCESDKAPRVPTAGPVLGACDPSEALSCNQGVLTRCDDAGVVREDCAAAGKTCDPNYGCVVCKPHHLSCEGDELFRCDRDGQDVTFVERCADGTQCSPMGCRDLCADALAERSYIGCEYWPTFTSNSQLDPRFLPAVVIANPNLIDVHVTIERPGTTTVREVVAPQSAKSVLLAFDPRLKGEPSEPGVGGSGVIAGGAYRLRASAPVTVYQFNPLLFELDGACGQPNPGEEQASRCNSFTNDASLLLPTHVLSQPDGGGLSYLGVSRATFSSEFARDGTRLDFPGLLAITAVGDRAVKVRVTVSAHTLPAADGSFDALAPGDVLEQTLMPGDVLQLRSAAPETCTGSTAVVLAGHAREHTVCDPGKSYDLTGSEIEADGPVQVIGGHDCTYVPYDQPACDHLEESLFPVETWGTDVVVTRPRQRAGASYVVRIISSANKNRITFTPKVAEPVTLGRGEFVELELDEHVLVRGTKPLLVAQYLKGQGGSAESGDPSLSLAIPIGQFRNEYYFLSPETYDVDYLNVIAPKDAEVSLDGERIRSWEVIEGSDFKVATITLSSAGQHVLRSDRGGAVGVVQYGYGDYTSYMLPGGLDLRIIAPPL